MTEEILRGLEERYFERLRESHDYHDIYTLWIKDKPAIQDRIAYLETYLKDMGGDE